MNRRWKYCLALILLGILASLLFWPKTEESKKPVVGNRSAGSQQSNNPSTQQEAGAVAPVSPNGLIASETDEQREKRLKLNLMNALNSPINFWGKVVDEQGSPVSGAKAEISITNKFSWDPTAENTRTKHVRSSDSEGLFSLLNERGGSLYVNVTAEGYASSIDDNTGRDLARADLTYSDENDHMHFELPEKGEPMVFVLRKKHPIANLSHGTKKGVALSKDGEVQRISLKVGLKIVDVEIRCWASSPVPFNYNRYDWRSEIQIVGGELQQITELEPVTAPTDGYQQVFKIDMPKNTDKNWLRSSPNGQRDFWVRFNDGTYAKARIEVKTGREHEVDVEVWHNLDGTNNFEQ